MSTLHTNIVETSSGGPVTLTKQSPCKMWCQFDATAVTVTAADSFNLSSIGDNAAGQYYQNFTNNMTDANYSSAGTTGGAAINSFATGYVASRPDTSARAMSSKYGGSFEDAPYWSAQTFGDLA